MSWSLRSVGKTYIAKVITKDYLPVTVLSGIQEVVNICNGHVETQWENQKMLRAQRRLEMTTSKGIRPRSCVIFFPSHAVQQILGSKEGKWLDFSNIGGLQDGQGKGWEHEVPDSVGTHPIPEDSSDHRSLMPGSQEVLFCLPRSWLC